MSQSHLAEKPIAVLGGGATGKLHAADCALAGREVRLAELPEFEDSIEGLQENGTLRVTGDQINKHGFRREGVAEIDLVTTDFEAALDGVGLVVVSIPAVGYTRFFEELLPHLEDGMVVHLLPGNFGSLVFRKMMREAGIDKDVVVGGWSSQPHGVRVQTESGVQLPELHVIYRAMTLRGGALPTRDQDAFVDSIEHLPSMESVVDPVDADDVIDIGFSNVNPVLHVPGTLLSLGAMENYGVIYGDDPDDFSIYSHGFCSSIAEVQSAFYDEVSAIADEMGVGIQPHDHEDFFSRDSILSEEYVGPEGEIPFDEHHDLLLGTGPFSLNNRYLTEDVPVGCHLYYELAQQYDVETPVLKSMITLGSVVTGTDYYDEGMTLDELGIAGLSKEELRTYLHEGTVSTS
jgi:opine dehydrogenase